jgi:molybdopterin converting factor small subunit
LPRVSFTSHLERFVDCPDVRVEGTTVREALEAVFRRNPRLRGYVVDEQGALREHMTVFVDGRVVQDKKNLSDAVGPDSELYVLQALSGG